MNWNELTQHIDRNKVQGCNTWTGSVSTAGYPICHYTAPQGTGRTQQVVRVIWEHERGVLHSTDSLKRTCDNPLCVKLAHHALVPRHSPIEPHQYHKLKEATAVYDENKAVYVLPMAVYD